MADITKCKGTNCNLASTCYRYTAPKGYLQAYFDTPPINKEINECEYYWKVNNVGMTPENHIDVLSEVIKQHIAEGGDNE